MVSFYIPLCPLSCGMGISSVITPSLSIYFRKFCVQKCSMAVHMYPNHGADFYMMHIQRKILIT